MLLLRKCCFTKDFLGAEKLQKKIKTQKIKLYEKASSCDPLILSAYKIRDSITEYQAKNFDFIEKIFLGMSICRKKNLLIR
jgi:hypothetical protein